MRRKDAAVLVSLLKGDKGLIQANLSVYADAVDRLISDFLVDPDLNLTALGTKRANICTEKFAQLRHGVPLSSKRKPNPDTVLRINTEWVIFHYRMIGARSTEIYTAMRWPFAYKGTPPSTVKPFFLPESSKSYNNLSYKLDGLTLPDTEKDWVDATPYAFQLRTPESKEIVWIRGRYKDRLRRAVQGTCFDFLTSKFPCATWQIRESKDDTIPVRMVLQGEPVAFLCVCIIPPSYPDLRVN